MNPVKKVSIIIPNRSSPIIDQVCSALHKQTYDLAHTEVIIVGTDDLSLVRCDHLIRFIPTWPAANAAINRNIGLQNAEGDILVFLDSDCIPHPDWLSIHIARHNSGEEVVGGGFTFGNSNCWQTADNISAFHEWLPFATAGPRPYLPAANLSVQRKIANSAGPMLPFLDRAQDLEWTIRLRRLGYSLYLEPRALVTHNPARTNFAAVWQHWFVNAKYTLWVRWTYRALLKTPRFACYRILYLLCAPIIALWATMNTFKQVETRQKYLATLPLVYLTKLIWCLGAFMNFPDLEGAAP